MFDFPLSVPQPLQTVPENPNVLYEVIPDVDEVADDQHREWNVELDATTHQYRDAQLALTDRDSDNVIVVVPTSMATSYFLTQHALTAIAVDSLSPSVRSSLDDVLEAPVKAFDLIQIGEWNTDSANHSLNVSQTPIHSLATPQHRATWSVTTFD